MHKILIFSWQHLWSMKKNAGAPSYHHTISYYLNSPDWDVYLFTADSTNLELNELVVDRIHLFKGNRIIENGMHLPKLNVFFRPLKLNAYNKWAEKEAEKTIESWEDTYIYAYEIWGVEIARRLAIKHACPLITRFQGTILNGEKKSCFHRIIRYPHFGALETKADLIIMTDDGTNGANVLKELENNSNCLFLRNGLDLCDIYESLLKNNNKDDLRKKYNIQETNVILMASRLVSWKRVDRGIKAFYEVQKKINDIRLIIAGDGEERASLEKYVNRLGISSKVSFLGSVEHSELCNYMLLSDVFVSLYDLSNLGNPVFEAMLLKLPIITLDVGMTGTVLHNNENCKMESLDNLHKIPNAIIELLIDFRKRQLIASKAYEYAVANFYNWQKRMEIEEHAILNLHLVE